MKILPYLLNDARKNRPNHYGLPPPLPRATPLLINKLIIHLITVNQRFLPAGWIVRP
jgi:hypothetical protein